MNARVALSAAHVREVTSMIRRRSVLTDEQRACRPLTLLGLVAPDAGTDADQDETDKPSNREIVFTGPAVPGGSMAQMEIFTTNLDGSQTRRSHRFHGTPRTATRSRAGCFRPIRS